MRPLFRRSAMKKNLGLAQLEHSTPTIHSRLSETLWVAVVHSREQLRRTGQRELTDRVSSSLLQKDDCLLAHDILDDGGWPRSPRPVIDHLDSWNHRNWGCPASRGFREAGFRGCRQWRPVVRSARARSFSNTADLSAVPTHVSKSARRGAPPHRRMRSVTDEPSQE
jgi:hypothetical protein